MNKKIIVIILILLAGVACEKETPLHSIQVKFSGFNEKPVEFGRTFKYEGFITGANIERDEVYVQGFSKLERKHIVFVVDILTGQVKKKKLLPYGSHESPTEFFNPSYMQFVGGRYLIIDQYDKIMAYDEQLNYLYTNVFWMHRLFIDFFEKNGETFFVIGEKKYGLKLKQNDIHLFRFRENNRPVNLEDLHTFTFKSLSYKDRQNRKISYNGAPWPSGTGFEKDGKIYFANYDEYQYYLYDINKKEKVVYKLAYLKAKTFSPEDAYKLEFHNSNGWEKRMFERRRVRNVAEPYPEPLYHFGIYDVGKGKIGVIGDIDLDKEPFEFRLDILDAAAGNYLESIRLPFGDGFEQCITDSARGMHYIFIDVDRCIYIWNNSEGKDFINYTRITSFKTVQEPQKQNE